MFTLCNFDEDAFERYEDRILVPKLAFENKSKWSNFLYHRRIIKYDT